MTLTRRILYLLLVLLIAATALGLHLRAVRMLPIDYDEDDYLAVAQRYALFMKAGDVQSIVDYAINYEHPPLTKLVYGAALLPLPEGKLVPEQPDPNIPPARSLPQPDFRVARTVSAVLGTLEVAALAVLNPLAGLFLAI